MQTHSWVLVSFSYGQWTECLCGYRPESQEDMDSHIAPTSNGKDLA